MIAIIDYDMGNLKSVSKALEQVGGEVCVTRDIKKIRSADKIVLPGVGAFPLCMENLQKYNLAQTILDGIGGGKLFLGICLGFQLLFETSEEFGRTQGLGLLKGSVKKFPSSRDKSYTVPHMGWNSALRQGSPKYLAGIPDESYFYFVHSFYVEPQDPDYVGTSTPYADMVFCSSLQKDNIVATQFHPEKSQQAGLKLLENFVKLK